MDCLRNISSNDVIAAISAAQSRVVFLAPGIDGPTADVLAQTWKRLGPEAVSVILDVDPEVARLGYGTMDGLEKIQAAGAAIGQGICHQPGVRICVVVTDGTSLIFTPTPLLIEAGSTQSTRPNGISLQTTPPVLEAELGAGASGMEHRTIGMKLVDAGAIEAAKKDLKENPPLQFDISRKERVFNSKLEFVEFELEGCFISRHTVTIPPDLVGMARMDAATRNKLRSSFRLIEKSEMLDAKNNLSEKALADERNRIGRKYLVAIKGYGTVILRANKEAFEAEVELLRLKVTAFQAALRGKLTAIYDDNATRLAKALLPSVSKNPPEQWTSVLGPKPGSKEISARLHQTLLRSFGEPESLLKDMKVNLVFKGVTYGTLTSKEFMDKATEALPPGKLMDEYDASRGSSAPHPSNQGDLFQP